jgi:hypothetical protein
VRTRILERFIVNNEVIEYLRKFVRITHFGTALLLSPNNIETVARAAAPTSSLGSAT